MSPPDPPRSRVVAVIRALRLDAVMERLHALGQGDVLVEQVRGYGRQKDHLGSYTLTGPEELFLPKVRLEFVVPSGDVAACMQAVAEAARTGRIGDGKVFAHAVNSAPAVGHAVAPGSAPGSAP
ncbi:MAG: P-II family nitrogen regulator [Planctomycetota bacterium]|nr:MAG: P-II family nitrogen regulator [Planctomycetota bacterium]